MEITGSFFPPAAYPPASNTGTNQTAGYPQQRPSADEQNRQASTSIQQTTKPQHSGHELNRKRFYSQEKELSHSARQALNSYIDSDFAGGPELMNRVDVYA